MKIIRNAKDKIRAYYAPIEDIVAANQEKVLKAFHAARVSSDSFNDSTGYAYSDLGRETLEAVYAHVFRAEAALVRPQIASGTHAISICLSLLEPGEELVSVSGPPYDTLQTVIGTRGSSKRSLLNRGVIYRNTSHRQRKTRFTCHYQRDYSEDPHGNYSALPGLQLATIYAH